MGIRLNRAMGWAMPMAKDPLDRDGNDLLHHPVSSHAEWLIRLADGEADEDRQAELLYVAAAVMATPNTVPLGSCALHVPELDGGTLLIIPPDYIQGWHRSDDDLDCAFAEGAPAETRITYPGYNPFGFSGRWMDAGTGIELNHMGHEFNKARGTERAEVAARRIRPAAGGPLLYPDAASADAAVVPMVPDSVRDIAAHLELFPQAPEQVLKLRPARAQWWV